MKIQSGIFSFGYISDPEKWNLDQGSGGRQCGFPISFPSEFDQNPSVMIALTGLDSSNGANTRVFINANDVNKLGFQLNVSTWADSEIFTVWGTWIAYTE